MYEITNKIQVSVFVSPVEQIYENEKKGSFERQDSNYLFKSLTGLNSSQKREIRQAWAHNLLKYITKGRVQTTRYKKATY